MDKNPNDPMFGCEDDYTTTVHSFEEASKECRGFIQRNELGNGNWSGGDIYENNKYIAEIAYNG